MHLTCTNMPVEKIDHALETIKSNGIQNVLALRGDPPHGQDKFVQVEGGFACALDLVRFSLLKIAFESQNFYIAKGSLELSLLLIIFWNVEPIMQTFHRFFFKLQVQHIRAKYGDYFGITVAGYPGPLNAASLFGECFQVLTLKLRAWFEIHFLNFRGTP